MPARAPASADSGLQAPQALTLSNSASPKTPESSHAGR